MANIIGAFSAQIVEMVRNQLSDEAILDLVRNQLDSVTGGVAVGPRVGRPRAILAVGGKPGRRPGRPRRASGAVGRRRGAPSPERLEALAMVEKIVKSGSGMSASEVAKAANLPQTRAAASLKELKLQKRIFQGGDRRFARYAGDAKTAEQASMHARRTASGPAVARRAARKAKKK